MTSARARKTDYGLDAPGIIYGGIAGGVVATAIGAGAIGIPLLTVGLVTYASSRYGKLRVRDHVFADLALRGDERVLDVGCGRGLLLVAAAKRLSTGRAIGLDLWSQTDQLDNRRAATLTNAELEGVSDRVEVVDGDMREMPFAAESFDVIVSNLAVHNVRAREERRRAITEMVRVLRPGGRVAIVDLAFTKDYAAWLGESGLVEVHRRWPMRSFFPPLGLVTARRR